VYCFYQKGFIMKKLLLLPVLLIFSSSQIVGCSSLFVSGCGFKDTDFSSRRIKPTFPTPPNQVYQHSQNNKEIVYGDYLSYLLKDDEGLGTFIHARQQSEAAERVVKSVRAKNQRILLNVTGDTVENGKDIEFQVFHNNFVTRAIAKRKSDQQGEQVEDVDVNEKGQITFPVDEYFSQVTEGLVPRSIAAVLNLKTRELVLSKKAKKYYEFFVNSASKNIADYLNFKGRVPVKKIYNKEGLESWVQNGGANLMQASGVVLDIDEDVICEYLTSDPRLIVDVCVSPDSTVDVVNLNNFMNILDLWDFVSDEEEPADKDAKKPVDAKKTADKKNFGTLITELSDIAQAKGRDAVEGVREAILEEVREAILKVIQHAIFEKSELRKSIEKINAKELADKKATSEEEEDQKEVKGSGGVSRETPKKAPVADKAKAEKKALISKVQNTVVGQVTEYLQNIIKQLTALANPEPQSVRSLKQREILGKKQSGWFSYLLWKASYLAVFAAAWPAIWSELKWAKKSVVPGVIAAYTAAFSLK
jgi:hypothetical protein